jgi:hypothetical protein
VAERRPRACTGPRLTAAAAGGLDPMATTPQRHSRLRQLQYSSELQLQEEEESYASMGYGMDDVEAMSPINPTTRTWTDLDGDVHGLAGAVHSSHSHVNHRRRQKTYLIATYTGMLSFEDVAEDWFIARPSELGDQSAAVVGPDLFAQIEQVARAQALDPELQRYAPSEVGSSPHTDASVSILLVGSRGDSGDQRLVYEGDDAEIFRPGHVDEFAITCEDLGDLQVWPAPFHPAGHDHRGCGRVGWDGVLVRHASVPAMGLSPEAPAATQAVEIWHENDGLDW